MLFLLQISTLLLANIVAGYLLPNPPGKYNVSLTTGPLIDYSRNGRALMLSVFQPTACESTVPVQNMPNKIAEHQGPFLQDHFGVPVDLSPHFRDAFLPVCPVIPSGCSPIEDGRILLFGPGLYFPRSFYNVLVSAIASEGFTVISMDHPNDTNIIVYPDGHTVYHEGPIVPTAEEFTAYVQPRVDDIKFIIDQLGNATAMGELLPQRGPRPFPTDRIAMLGHSMGGVAAVIAAGQEPRLRGAIDWDGTLFGELPLEGISTPVLYVSEANATDPSWVKVWPQLNGPKLWIEVANTTHMSFADGGTLFQAAGQDMAPFADLLGSIAPAQLLQILVAYTTAWMDGALSGKVGGPLLGGQEPDRFPEVKTVTKSNF